jgi:hypothetical protein
MPNAAATAGNAETMKALLGNAREDLDRYVWRRVTGVGPVG